MFLKEGHFTLYQTITSHPGFCYCT